MILPVKKETGQKRREKGALIYPLYHDFAIEPRALV